MPRVTRRRVLASIGALATGGCAGRSLHGGTPTDPTPDSAPPEGGTSGIDHPEPDHAIYLDNQHDRAWAIRVEIVRVATGETVFETTRTVEPGTEVQVYNLARAHPEGIEPFRICGEFDGGPSPNTTIPTETTPSSSVRDCITAETNACFGTAHITVADDGGLNIIYSIC